MGPSVSLFASPPEKFWSPGPPRDAGAEARSVLAVEFATAELDFSGQQTPAKAENDVKLIIAEVLGSGTICAYILTPSFGRGVVCIPELEPYYATAVAEPIVTSLAKEVGGYVKVQEGSQRLWEQSPGQRHFKAEVQAGHTSVICYISSSSKCCRGERK